MGKTHAETRCGNSAYIGLYPYAYLFLCLSVPLSICPSGCPSLCLSVPLSVCSFVSLSLCLSVPLSIYRIYLSNCLFVHLPLCLTFGLSICFKRSRSGPRQLTKIISSVCLCSCLSSFLTLCLRK